MTGRLELRAHMTQARTARAVSWGLFALALFALVWKGPPHALAAAALALVFRAAVPAPDARLDALTGRRARED